MTYSIVDGQPAAVEALKPLVEVIAAKMRGEDNEEANKAEHAHQLALVRERNKSFADWLEQAKTIWQNCLGSDVSVYERAMRAFTASTTQVFGPSFQIKPDSEEIKSLPPRE